MQKDLASEGKSKGNNWTGEVVKGDEIRGKKTRDVWDGLKVVVTSVWKRMSAVILGEIENEVHGEMVVEDLDWETAVTDNMKNFSWDKAYYCDLILRTIYKRVAASGEMDGFKIQENQMLTFNTSGGERVCIPANLLCKVLYVIHDALGNMEYKKTYDRSTHKYYRPGLSKQVEQYVFGCPKCSINKISCKKPPGSLLLVNNSGKAFDIPMTSNYTAMSSANLFVEWAVHCGWLLSKFIRDRGAKFLSEFWQAVIQALHIWHKPSTIYHAQADSMTEHLNQIIEIMLRAYVSPLQDDWLDHIPILELAYNSAKNVSTGFAPIQLIYTQPQDILEYILYLDAIHPGNSKRETAQEWLEKSQNRICDAMEAIRNHMLQQTIAVELDLPKGIGIHPVISVQRVEQAPNPSQDPWKCDYPRPGNI